MRKVGRIGCRPLIPFTGLPDGNADPIDYLCRCFSYDASEAVEVTMNDPSTPLQDLTGRRFLYDYPGGKRAARPHRMLWLFNALAEQLKINAADTADRSNETSELLCVFTAFIEGYAFGYLTARHPQSANFAAAIDAVQKTYCQDGLLLKLSVSPDEFARRLRTLLDLDAQRDTPETTNADILIAVKASTTEAHVARVAAERAAAGIEELAAEMTAWREWVRELAKNPNAKPSEPKLCATVQGKICEIWQRFKDEPADCELPNGKLRKTKRTFAECLAQHGRDEVWSGKRLIDFIPDEKAFERVVHNGAEKVRQAKAKAKAKPPKTQKRKTQARRKK